MAVQLLRNTDERFEVTDSDLELVTDGDPETVYVYRQVPPHITREINKRHTRTHAGQTPTFDHFGAIDDLVDYALVDWRGILDDGVAVECRREYKVRLDYQRKSALIALAGRNRVAKEDRDHSFRSPDEVLRVLGRSAS